MMPVSTQKMPESVKMQLSINMLFCFVFCFIFKVCRERKWEDNKDEDMTNELINEAILGTVNCIDILMERTSFPVPYLRREISGTKP